MNQTDFDRDPWETGELGRSMEHVAVAPEEFALQLDESTGMQLVSIRLQKTLVKNLKLIAEHHGINYQPMIRDLLNRFARSEMRTILLAKLDEVKAAEQAHASEETSPVAEFLEREFQERELQRRRA